TITSQRAGRAGKPASGQDRRTAPTGPMAEPKPFQFDSEQRSVGAAGSRRRSAWPWIALSLALHGAIALFALLGAARGGHSELLGTLEVTVVGTPTAGDPDSRAAQGEAETKPEPSALPRPEATPTSPRPLPYCSRRPCQR